MKPLLSILLILSTFTLKAENKKYWVFFTDKKEVRFDPLQYFSAKAIERRLKNDLPLCDSSDFPLNATYVNAVAQKADSIGWESRWFNALVIWANENQEKAIRALPFVKELRSIQLHPQTCQVETKLKTKDNYKLDAPLKELLWHQINSMEGYRFAKQNINGKGVLIAVFDGGFNNLNKRPEFKELFDNNRIIKTFDFQKKKEDVYFSTDHGTAVVSNITGKYNGEILGLAQGADFLLARTEVVPERYYEEENWLAAVEWADKNGADIISSSLGYTHHLHFRKEMDGRSLVSQAAEKAFEKGILVVNSAGNEGTTSRWKYIGAPADAEHVLSVGGISPDTYYHIDFSSYGPTADGRMKPNVAAMGHTLVIGKRGVKDAFGTSFSCPLVSGFAACVMQLNPQMQIAELFDLIQKSGHLYPYFDYSHGYGIPQASFFLQKKQKPLEASFLLKQEDKHLLVKILKQYSNELTQKPYLYYHIADENGKIKEYKVIEVYRPEALEIDLNKLKKGDTIRIYYRKYIKEFKV